MYGAWDDSLSHVSSEGLGASPHGQRDCKSSLGGVGVFSWCVPVPLSVLLHLSVMT